MRHAHNNYYYPIPKIPIQILLIVSRKIELTRLDEKREGIRNYHYEIEDWGFFFLNETFYVNPEIPIYYWSKGLKSGNLGFFFISSVRSYDYPSFFSFPFTWDWDPIKEMLIMIMFFWASFIWGWTLKVFFRLHGGCILVICQLAKPLFRKRAGATFT